jgi:hypothetical protein
MLRADKKLLASYMQNSFLESAEYAMNMTLLLDNFNFALVLVDNKGIVKVLNTMAEYSFGLERIKALNKSLNQCPDLAPLAAIYQKCFQEPPEDIVVLEMPQTDGVPWFMNLRCLTLKDSRENMAGIIFMLSPLSFRDALPSNKQWAQAESIVEGGRIPGSRMPETVA